MVKRIGVLNGGGDCAGLNAVIASIVKTGIPTGYEFVGYKRGWEGLLDRDFVRLDFSSVRGISHLGGTILHTTNRGRFGAKQGAGNKKEVPLDIRKLARDNLAADGVQALVAIGGDGTLSGASQLADIGVNVVGVPKTIDNDLGSTDRTFGFSTAVQVVVDAMDRIHTTASSHDRVIVVEAMGRHAGWIAMEAGLSGGADVILIPEFPTSIEKVVEYLRLRVKHNMNSCLILVAEGFKLTDDEVGKKRGGMEVLLGGISQQVMHRIEELAPGEFDIRHAILGHIQRGGRPEADDRTIAKAYGVAAMQAVHERKWDTMVAFQRGEMTTVPIKEAVDQLKLVSRDCLAYKTAKALGVFIDEVPHIPDC